MSDPTLYLYTSLTAGSSHIVTATARLETILKANKLPFRAIDVATDEVARKLWGRRSKGKKLPGLVKFGTVVGDLEQVEEWNEYGELRMQVNSVEDFDSIPATSTTTAQPETPSATSTPTPETATLKQSTIKIQSPPSKETPKDSSIAVAMRQASEEAAARAKGNSSQPPAAKEPTPAVTEKKESPAADEQSQAGKEDTVRGNTAAPDTQDSKPKRPPLVPEVAAESSANFHADAAEALGLVQHHRGSIISATSKEEQDKVAQDLRKSISGGQQDLLQSLREDHAARTEQEETIEEESDGGEQQDGTPSRKEAQDVQVSG